MNGERPRPSGQWRDGVRLSEQTLAWAVVSKCNWTRVERTPTRLPALRPRFKESREKVQSQQTNLK